MASAAILDEPKGTLEFQQAFGLVLIVSSALILLYVLLQLEHSKLAFCTSYEEHDEYEEDDSDDDNSPKQGKSNKKKKGRRRRQPTDAEIEKELSEADAYSVADEHELELELQSVDCGGSVYSAANDDDGMSLSSNQQQPQLAIVGDDIGPAHKLALQQTNQAATFSLRLHRPIALTTKLWFAFQIGLLITLNYLLLVYLPGTSKVLAIGTALALWFVVLHSTIKYEWIANTGDTLMTMRTPTTTNNDGGFRKDRLLTILTCFWAASCGLSLTVFARLSLQEGSIYQGPARIVGYDYTAYDNNDGETLRTNLQVTWGSNWGCPDMHDINYECMATVSGAMCQTDYEPAELADEEIVFYLTTDDDGMGGRHRHLALNSTSATVLAGNTTQTNATSAVTNATVGQDATSTNSSASSTQEQQTPKKQQQDPNTSSQNQEQEQQNIEEMEETIAENEAEVAEMEEENEELKEENEELEEDLEDEEEYEDELIDLIDYYEDYTDDYYEDEYWTGYDWDQVWGEYACEDLFATDMAGQTYSTSAKPGSDQWPFIYIYGSCNSCNAFLMDYYSTEHFAEIKSYRTHAIVYGVLSVICAILAIVSFCRRRKRLLSSYYSNKEKEIELLACDNGGGGVAA